MTSSDGFLDMLTAYYQKAGRDQPWRRPEWDGSFDAYKILVSEIMLQQTQVPRVIPKYLEFLRLFPDVAALAKASLPEVLAAWSGLGYNRRAMYLYEAAKLLSSRIGPWGYEDLTACKGIGHNTAAAVLAYSYDQPVLFVETNIRTVLIYHFFTDEQGISDKVLLDTLSRVAPWNNGQKTSPREFYWAMMDYGTYLKATVGNQNHRSQSYIRQAKFEGSRRQVRGRLIKLLLMGPRSVGQVREAIPHERLDEVIGTLEREGMVTVQGNTLMLYNKGKQ